MTNEFAGKSVVVTGANAALFLASDNGRYITGVTLPVDAGTVVS